MKNRVKAILLAASLALGIIASQAFAEGEVEPISEVSLVPEEGAETESQFAPYYDQMKASVSSTLEQLSAMTDEQLNEIVEGTDAQNAAIAAAWLGVKKELGVYTGAAEQTITEGDHFVRVDTVALYDEVPENTRVNVGYIYDTKYDTTSMEWDIRYPMSKLIREAGLNTLLGLGTVFIVLVFLSLVIGNIHWIPDLIEGRKKKEAAAGQKAAPAAPAPAPEAVPEVQEEDLTSDEELVAVIAAAIAASEQVSPEGFVVRSIKKANRRKWLGA